MKKYFPLWRQFSVGWFNVFQERKIMSLLYVGIFSLYTIVLVLIIYVFFFADPYKKGMSGDFARFLTRTIPRKIREISMACFGSTIMESFGRVFDYVLHQRNPLLIIAYLIVINSAFLGWLLYGEPQLPTKLASNIHSYIGFIGVVACQISFYLACTMSPGVITSQNVEKFNHVPFDGILYVSEKVCTTCRIPKVRSLKLFFTLRHLPERFLFNFSFRAGGPIKAL